MAIFLPGVNGQPNAPVWDGHEVDPTDSVYSAGAQSYEKRLPLVGVASTGALVMFCEERAGTADQSVRAILARRSTDGGNTWGQPYTVHQLSGYSSNSKWLNLGSVVTASNGNMILLWTESNGASGSQVHTIYQQTSTDHGVTWGARSQITGVMKVNNSSPAGLPSAYGLTNAAWVWFAFGPHRGICVQNGANAGRLIVPCNHRYVVGNPSWANVIYSDDNGATWALGGGFDETNATNDYTNETAICEIGSAGKIYVSCRITSGSGAIRRGTCVFDSTSITSTWPTMTYMTSDGSNDVRLQECAASLLTAASGNVYLACTLDSAQRQHLRIWCSTPAERDGAGKPTFSTYRSIYYGPAGYSTMWQNSSGVIGLAAEVSNDYTNTKQGGGDGMNSCQYLKQWRFDESWFTGESSNPATALWQFNDGVVGVATNTSGTSLRNWQGYAPDGRGGSGATFHADGLTFGGSGGGVILAEVNGVYAGNMGDVGVTGDITYEGIFSFPATISATGMVFDNRDNSGAGVTCSIGTNGKLTFVVHDGTNSCSVTSTGAYNDATYRAYAFTYSRSGGVTIYVNGVSDGTTANNLSNTYIVGDANFRVGSQGNGSTSPLPSGTLCKVFKITHKALTTGFLTTSYTKTSAAVSSGFSPSFAATPSATNLKLHLACPLYGTGSTERFAGYDWPYRPLQRGTGLMAYRDHSSLDRMWAPPTASTGHYWDYDSTVGWHVRAQTSSSWRRSSTSDYDFIQNTALFTLLMVFKVVATNGASYSLLFDNNGQSGTVPGFSLWLVNATNKLGCFITRTSALRFNENPVSASATFSFDTWYFLAVRGNGPSAKLDFRYKALTGQTAPGTLTQFQGTSNVDSTDGTFNSTGAIGLGSNSGNTVKSNWRHSNILLFNTNLSNSAIDDWATWMMTVGNQTPVSLRGRMQKMRLGYRVGL